VRRIAFCPFLQEKDKVYPVECEAYSSGAKPKNPIDPVNPACPVKCLPRLPCSSGIWYWGRFGKSYWGNLRIDPACPTCPIKCLPNGIPLSGDPFRVFHRGFELYI